MSKRNKLGLVFLWLTGLTLLLGPAFMVSDGKPVFIFLASMYVFVTWVAFILNLTLEGATHE